MASLSMRVIAEAAGVSAATVSYALNGKAGVSEKNRRRILAVAKKLGYEPDAEMVKLMAHVSQRRTHDTHSTLALITQFGSPRSWEWNPSVRALWEGAGTRARELGYKVEEFCYDAPGMTPQRLRGILRARDIQGLLLSMIPDSYQRFDFDFSGFASAMSGPCFHEPELPVVMSDHFRNTMLGLEHAYRLGYRRPLLALIAGAAERTEHTMEGAYLYFGSTHPDVELLPAFRSTDYEITPFCEYVRRHKPDVVLCTHGDWGRQLGEAVPKQFGWLSLSWTAADTDLAGVDRRLHEQAGCVVDMVVASLHRHESGIPTVRKEVMIKGRIADGASLPKRAAPAQAKVQKRGTAAG